MIRYLASAQIKRISFMYGTNCRLLSCDPQRVGKSRYWLMV